MIKVGRYTAALLLVAVGGFLLADQLLNTDYLSLLIDWWPVVLIALGVEFLIVNLTRGSEKQLKLDFGGIILAVIISIAVTFFTHGSSFQSIKFLDNIDFIFSSSSGESGPKYEKGVTPIPIRDDTLKIVLDNANGSIKVQPGDVNDLRIDTTMWVDRASDQEANRVVETSEVTYTEGTTISVVAKGEMYGPGKKRKPRMNLVVTVPESRKLDLEIHTRNGTVEAKQITVNNKLAIDTTNREVKVSEITGNVKISTTNSRAQATDIAGSIEISSTNGSLTAGNIKGSAVLDTSNASITANNIGGDLNADTSNSSIKLSEVYGKVRADTSNGTITVASGAVNGDWNLDTTNSRIEITVPSDGNFRVEGKGSHGNMKSELPLAIKDNAITGTIGSGTYMIRMDTSNSGITVKQAH